MKTQELKIENLEFSPVNRYFSRGNETQICETKYKGVSINEWTHFPYSFFGDKEPITYYVVDLVLPMTTVVKGGEMSNYYYTEDGYGLAVIKTLEDTIEFIDKYSELKN
jgi:hypothetical protein